MTDQQTTTNGVNLPAPVQQMREQLPVLLQNNIPWMEKKHAAAMELLESITPPTTDEECEDAVAKLAAVSKVYTAISEKRKEMTEITDAFKNIVMEFERPFDTKSDKSKYQERRKCIEQYQQNKLEQRRREEQEAVKKKEVENLKIDLRAKMLENLSNMIVASVKRVDAGSKDYFDTATHEDFDKKAEAYKSNKPKLKQTEYDACFQLQFNFDLIKPDDVATLVKQVQQEESFEKWNTAFVEAISPIINEWWARIPEMKKQKDELADLAKKSQKEAEELAKKQKEQLDLQFNERQAKLETVVQEQKKSIQEDAQLQKISNEFAAQAAIQTMVDPGSVKLVAKFSDPKTTPKALMNVIYHVFSSDKFEGIQKRDKNKKLVFDDKGRPVYIDAVQYWLDHFLRHCNAGVEGLEIFEDSKVTIR